MKSARSSPRQSGGFTLIEVVVALAICGWVLASAFWLVDRYAYQRTELSDRFYANQIGWNQLMTLYQSGQGWAEQDQLETTGSAKAAGHRWHWQLQSKPTIGAELIRYQLLVAPHAEHEPVARPVLYMSATP